MDLVKRGDFAERYGPWAVVAGGSEGLGAAFAEALAARGINLVLLARRELPLAAVASRLADRHHVEVRTLSCDLAAPDLVHQIDGVTARLDVGLVVANAADARVARFVEVELEDKLHALDVNCRAPLVLAHLFAPKLQRRGRGGFIVMSSLAGLYGGPFIATYAATKAFGCVLAESLAGELGADGVDVMACVAGPTRTPTFEKNSPGAFAPMSPERVVRETLAALGRTPRLVPGVANRAMSRLVSLLPRRWVIPLVAAQTRKFL